MRWTIGRDDEVFTDFGGTPVDIEMRQSSPATLAGLAERAGLRIEALQVRAPYEFEHASRRIYLEASAG